MDMRNRLCQRSRAGRAVLLVLVLLTTGGPMTGHAARDAGAGAVLRQALQVMKHNLHTVHAQSTYISGPLSKMPGPLTVTGDCQVVGQRTVTRFRLVGWRMTQSDSGKMRPEQIDETFVTLEVPGTSEKIWERSAHTAGHWQRADSNDDASIGTLLCPSSRLFLFGCLNQKCTRAGVVVPPTLRDLGTRTIHGQPTRYLHSAVVMTGHDARGKPIRSTTIEDFYIARKTQFLVRLVQTGTVTSGTKTTFQASTRVEYSRHNQPVRIAIPSV